ncbi:MAG: acyl-CoA dehydrogenase C-terminal domain-containing protein, partial [Rhizobiaceae bacterium]
TGAAQLMRDARIAPIYEGTNGIQAIDLATRKLPLAGGEAVNRYIGELRETVDEIAKSIRDELSGIAEPLSAALDDMEAATAFLLNALEAGNRQTALAGATPYLRIFGLASGGAHLAKSALTSPDADMPTRAAMARFMAQNLVAETTSLRRTVEDGAESLLAAGEMLMVG